MNQRNWSFLQKSSTLTVSSQYMHHSKDNCAMEWLNAQSEARLTLSYCTRLTLQKLHVVLSQAWWVHHRGNFPLAPGLGAPWTFNWKCNMPCPCNKVHCYGPADPFLLWRDIYIKKKTIHNNDPHANQVFIEITTSTVIKRAIEKWKDIFTGKYEHHFTKHLQY